MKMLPYGRQLIEDDDIAAVVEVLKSDRLTTGPKVAEFENAFAEKVGAKYAVAVNSGTAALHAAMFAIGIRTGDEVILPPITFAATANSVVFQGGKPVFADVLPDSLLIDPGQIERKITERTKAIVSVDYAGLPCDYDTLKEIAHRHDLAVVADACHALGATHKGHRVGALADLNCFSFHPVKHITTGEGGMITTDNSGFAQRMRDFRNHGITRDSARFTQVSASPQSGKRPLGGKAADVAGLPPSQGFGVASKFQVSHYYEMQSLGYNYRLSDISCALGLSQLKKLDRFVARRREIAARYDDAFHSLPSVVCPPSSAGHAYHLYVVQIDFPKIGKTREQVVQTLEKQGVGTQVHYLPVHLHPYYRRIHGCRPGLCPVAEATYQNILSLPLFPAMSDHDVERVIVAVKGLITA